MKKVFSLILGIVMLCVTIYSAPIVSANGESISLSEVHGGLESIYAKWCEIENADFYNVYYKKADNTDFIKTDDSLVRKYADYMRVDILGLSEGDYIIKVVPLVNNTEDESRSAVSDTVHVLAYTREGFAFSDKSPYKTTNGGYNSDGTEKENADIIYVTDQNKDYVTVNNDETYGVGITDILNKRDKAKSETPMIIRFLGKVSMPKNVENYMLKVSNTKNVTLEGVGDDATLHGWGLTFKRACNIEVRNLGIMWYGGVGGDGDSLSLDTENKNLWLHNNDFFYGAPGGDSDQAKGDGSIDLKSKSDYITISYNHFWDSGKTCVSGGVWESKNPDDPEAKIFITYHHNWFDHSDSRHPRCVAGSTHVYNNYYDGVAKYGIGAAVQSSVFVEKNYFRNCPRPMLIATQGSDCYDSSSGTYTNKGTLSGQTGGMIKEYDNIIIGAKRFYTYQTTPDEGEFDAYTVTSRDETVPSTVCAKYGGSTYNNFDTSDIMYDYTPDTPENAVEKIKKYAGRVDGGDFKYVFDNSVQDTNSDVIPELRDAILNYTSGLIEVQGIEDAPVVSPDASASPTPTNKPSISVGSSLIHNFTTDELNSDLITFGDTCSIKSGKDTISYKNLTLTKCLEIGSSTMFSFTAPKSGTCTFVFSTTKSANVKVNDQKLKGDVTSGLLSFSVEKGEEYTITKSDNAYLFCIDFIFDEDSEGGLPYSIDKCEYLADGSLSVTISQNDNTINQAKLIIAVYSDDESTLSDLKTYDINGENVIGLDFIKPSTGKVKAFIWSDLEENMTPVSESLAI